MTALERVRPCEECGRPTRPSSSKLDEFPGTVIRGGRGLCMTCYGHIRPTLGHLEPRATTVRQVSRDVVFAIVPEPVRAQQSDCRVSCCKTPFMCATRYRCACHLGGAR
jgi:hypothetical protein